MGISHYLAMTGVEIAAAEALPENIAYMACHFSPYGTGLTGAPEVLPKHSMLILNDRIPFNPIIFIDNNIFPNLDTLIYKN